MIDCFTRFISRIALLLYGSLIFMQPGFAAASLCGIIEMDESLIRMDSTGADDQAKACNRWREDKSAPLLNVEVNFSSLNPDVPKVVRVTRSQTTTPWIMPSFIRPGSRIKPPELDRKRLNDAFNGWPVYESKAREMLRDGGSLAIAVKFSQRSTNGGSYLIAELSYFNELTKEKWHEGYFSFYKPHKISVSYSSNSLLSDAPADRDFLRKMKKLFISMRAVDWQRVDYATVTCRLIWVFEGWDALTWK